MLAQVLGSVQLKMCPLLQVWRCLASPIQVISVSIKTLQLKSQHLQPWFGLAWKLKGRAWHFPCKRSRHFQSRNICPFYFMLERSQSGIREIFSFLAQKFEIIRNLTWSGECLQGLCRWRRGSWRPSQVPFLIEIEVEPRNETVPLGSWHLGLECVVVHDPGMQLYGIYFSMFGWNLWNMWVNMPYIECLGRQLKGVFLKIRKLELHWFSKNCQFPEHFFVFWPLISRSCFFYLS